MEEDRKAPLSSRLQKLDSVTFHRKLGTVGQKVRRIVGLSETFAEAAGVTAAQAKEAARLAKADLETLIVFEFPELQGQMGAYYARKEGMEEAIATAIAEHYRPAGADDALPSTALAALVAVSDRVDTLVGCFGAGLKPKGNKDPFALRRAAHALMRIALGSNEEDGPIDVDLGALFSAAYDQYEAALAEKSVVLEELGAFCRARLVAFYKDSGYRSDVIDAALGAWDGGSLRDLDARLRAVEALRGTDAFASLAVAFKRAFNITKDSGRGDIDASLLEAGAEQDLMAAFERVRENLWQATVARRYEEALRLVASELRGPIDRYFDEVFVMHDDEAIRQNRLRLLGAIADAVHGTAHFHRLAGDA